MNTLTIIQARMASTRLPNKVMKKLCVRAACRWHRTILFHVINRLLACHRLDRIVVATTNLPQN